MHDAATTTTRRTFALSRLLPALAVALLSGATWSRGGNAEVNSTKTTTSIRKRVDHFQKSCERGGGKMADPIKKPGGTTVTCNGGKNDGLTCTYSKKSSRCHYDLTNPPTLPLEDVSAPPTGGNEDPTGGGPNPGGGGGIDPGSGADPGETGGGVLLAAFAGDQHSRGKHAGKRKSQRRGRKSR
jgi:hypothetical protein